MALQRSAAIVRVRKGAATRELIKDNLDEKQSATLIDEAIKDLPEKLHWPA